MTYGSLFDATQTMVAPMEDGNTQVHRDDPRPGKDRHRHQHNKQNLQTRHKIQHTPVIMINNKDSGTILPSNLRTGQEIRIFYCKFRLSNIVSELKRLPIRQWNLFNFGTGSISRFSS